MKPSERIDQIEIYTGNIYGQTPPIIKFLDEEHARREAWERSIEERLGAIEIRAGGLNAAEANAAINEVRERIKRGARLTEHRAKIAGTSKSLVSAYEPESEDGL